jgi:hypothetical protein
MIVKILMLVSVLMAMVMYGAAADVGVSDELMNNLNVPKILMTVDGESALHAFDVDWNNRTITMYLETMDINGNASIMKEIVRWNDKKNVWTASLITGGMNGEELSVSIDSDKTGLVKFVVN